MQVVSYDTLQSELGITDIRVMEDLLTETIYLVRLLGIHMGTQHDAVHLQGLVSGRIDHRQNVFKVTESRGRDVRLDLQLDQMIARLTEWYYVSV